MDPTEYTYFALYWRTVCNFLLEFTLGLLALLSTDGGDVDGWFRVGHGLIYAVPPFVLLYVGRDQLFEMMVRRLEAYQAEADGESGPRVG